MKKELTEFYTGNVNRLTSEIRRLRRRNRIFAGTELATFAAAIGFVAAYTVYGGSVLPVASAVMLTAYIAARRLDVRNSERIEHTENICKVYASELSYLSGDFSPFDDGSRHTDPKHPYSFDMDIFGPLSLYNRICRTVTTGGGDRLAEYLSSPPFLGAADSKSLIDARREAISRIAGMEQLRTEFLSLGQNGRIDTPSVLEAIAKVRQMSIPQFALSPVAVAAAWTAIAGLAASVALAALTPVSANVPLLWGTLQFAAVFTLCSKPLRMISAAVNSLHRQLRAYAELIRLITSTALKDTGDPLVAPMSGDDAAEARQSFGELRRILDGLDRRGNVLGLVIFDTFLLSDFFLVRRFLKWQRRYLGRIGQWIDNVSTTDALVSMATFRYNEPEAGNAEIAEGEDIIYEAKGLYHPFLGAKAVRNDFSIADGNYYIVTGANMAGKSTFLRSVGVNHILAMNGMPVFAESLRVSVFSLFSSMRTSDDLGHGISYFNAELLRLRQLIENCKRARRTLIILDEILKGTNSLDKLNGSRMFLDAISALPVSGVIATHDLELSKMADERPGRFHNWCFEIRLSDDITYTYKITPGVARNQNATHLLRNIIREIDGSSGREP